MSLPGYGILYGTVTFVRAPRAAEPHWLLIVQPQGDSHIAYRVAIQLADDGVGIEAQWCDLATGNAAAQGVGKRLLSAFGSARAPAHFLTADDSRAGGRVPGLDYVRSGIVPLAGFKATSAAATDPVAATFAKLVRRGAKVVICGTGTPVDAKTGAAPSTGFAGVTNVHMNQGTRTWIQNQGYHDENGPNQDGALFVLQGSSVMALFLKYANQSLKTDAHGEPTDSGIPSIDAAAAAAAPVLAAYHQAQAQEAAADAQAEVERATSNPAQAAGGFIFQEPPGSVANDPFKADNDAAVLDNPVAQAYAQGKQQAPEYLRGGVDSLVMTLESVRGKTFVDTLAGGIDFDFIGDSGAVTLAMYNGEESVAKQMTELAKTQPPAFCFHVGDVVYFFGEADYVPCQFGIPFKDYPAPIFAVPGNHDAAIYDDQHQPLQAFIEIFCADKPAQNSLLGGVARTTMTQPGTYFTLDAPHVSIVGLFSNAAESKRYMSKQQLTHFLAELTRLKQLRDQGDKRAIILAVHHLPQFYAASPDAMSKGLDAACTQVGLWPDAVVVGHAHLYQRFVRTVGTQQIPYIVTGNGGYRINSSKNQAAGVTGKPGVDRNLVDATLGFVRASCRDGKLSFNALDKTGASFDKLTLDLVGQTVSIG